MQIPNGIYSKVDDYGYGYNGMEKDDELKGSGKLYSTLFREGDTENGRWWKRDPLEMDLAGLSPYTMMGSNPIRFIDPHGLFQEDPNENLSPGEEVGETAEWEGEEVIWDGNSWDYSTGEVIVEAERENYDAFKNLGMEVLGLVNSVVSNAFWQPTNIISVDGMEDFFNVEFTEIQKQYFAEGETEGHLVTLAIVAAEAVAGTSLEVGGAAAAIPTGGSSLLATAAGVTISAHSAGALVVATAKLLEAEQKLDLMYSQGNKNLGENSNDIPEGFKPVKEFGRPHGQKVYKYKGKYYSKDVGSDGSGNMRGPHHGGRWKRFIKKNGKLKRDGTVDENLNKINK